MIELPFCEEFKLMNVQHVKACPKCRDGLKFIRKQLPFADMLLDKFLKEEKQNGETQKSQ